MKKLLLPLFAVALLAGCDKKAEEPAKPVAAAASYIDKIKARDKLIVRGVNVFPTQVEEQVLKVKQLCECYEIHLYRNGNLDSVDVHVELKAEHQHLGDEQQKVIAGELSRHIKTYIGISTRIVLQPMHSIKRSEGKACHVIDNRP